MPEYPVRIENAADQATGALIGRLYFESPGSIARLAAGPNERGDRPGAGACATQVASDDVRSCPSLLALPADPRQHANALNFLTLSLAEVELW